VTTTTAPILVVGTRFDPATPYAWAEALHRQLPTSSLLTYEGDGHTAYGSGSNCIDRAIDAYFLTGAMPAPGKSCT
jgi:pimeloyl-ACP methyl ester carboxylesterase